MEQWFFFEPTNIIKNQNIEVWVPAPGSFCLRVMQYFWGEWPYSLLTWEQVRSALQVTEYFTASWGSTSNVLIDTLLFYSPFPVLE
jgi:hypothetical protein